MDFPKSIQTLNKALAAFASPATLQKIGATNVQIVSPRSVRFDLPDGKAKEGINRVKLTARDDGTVDIRFIEVIERDLVGGIAPEKVGGVIEAFTGISFAA